MMIIYTNNWIINITKYINVTAVRIQLQLSPKRNIKVEIKTPTKIAIMVKPAL